jgi:hypothetical protein
VRATTMMHSQVARVASWGLQARRPTLHAPSAATAAAHTDVYDAMQLWLIEQKVPPQNMEVVEREVPHFGAVPTCVAVSDVQSGQACSTQQAGQVAP